MDQGDSVAAIFNQADAAGWDIQHVALGPGTSEQLISQLTTPDNLIVTSPFFFDEMMKSFPAGQSGLRRRPDSRQPSIRHVLMTVCI